MTFQEKLGLACFVNIACITGGHVAHYGVEGGPLWTQIFLIVSGGLAAALFVTSGK